MTKFRSILSFATISALCLGLVACGSNDAEKSTVEDISIDSENTTIGSDVTIKAGKWSVHTEISDFKLTDGKGNALPGMGAGQIGTSLDQEICITAEEAANPGAKFMTGEERSNCSKQEITMENGTVDMHMQCTGEDGTGVVEIKMKGTYSAESIDTNMTMTGDTGNGAMMSISSKIQQKYLGACDG